MSTHTDTQIVDWLEKHPRTIVPCSQPDRRRKACWRRVFGPKDEANHFTSLRAAVAAQISSR